MHSYLLLNQQGQYGTEGFFASKDAGIGEKEEESGTGWVLGGGGIRGIIRHYLT